MTDTISELQLKVSTIFNDLLCLNTQRNFFSEYPNYFRCVGVAAAKDKLFRLFVSSFVRSFVRQFVRSLVRPFHFSSEMTNSIELVDLTCNILAVYNLIYIIERVNRAI